MLNSSGCGRPFAPAEMERRLRLGEAAWTLAAWADPCHPAARGLPTWVPGVFVGRDGALACSTPAQGCCVVSSVKC